MTPYVLAKAETPPLARGRHKGFNWERVPLRNTPACAGKTRTSDVTQRLKRKHPRLRGEDEASKPRIGDVPETPPLARGRLTIDQLFELREGNTPACAGKTRKAHTATPRCEKHPRLRGEDFDPSIVSVPVLETPPLARGRRQGVFKQKSEHRNTPACAGKTSRRPRQNAAAGKHPRLRGEDERSEPVHISCTETPPLARGRLEASPFRRGFCGNTPACAGKTRNAHLSPRSSRKHPRLRGEDGLNGVPRASAGETPPLARGRLAHPRCLR